MHMNYEKILRTRSDHLKLLRLVVKCLPAAIIKKSSLNCPNFESLNSANLLSRETYYMSSQVSKHIYVGHNSGDLWGFCNHVQG